MNFWDHHKTITSCYELLAKDICDKYKLTQMEYNILMFLHNNPQYNTAADIVKIRKCTKSHVSTSIKELETKGYIKRVQNPNNKKQIEIILSNKALPIIEDGIKTQKIFAQNILNGLTEQEKRTFIDVFNKVCNNAEKYLKTK